MGSGYVFMRAVQSDIRRIFRAVIVLGLTTLATACAIGPSRPAIHSGGVYKVGASYQVAGVRYTPREQPNYDETGIASWYGPGFHGRHTANGETFDQNTLTAAHATLPLPVSVRVTNLDNGRSLVVRVNDRGPFHDGRIIDLSARAAELLGFKVAGTARVRVQYLGPANAPDFAVAQAAPPPKPVSPATLAPTDLPVVAMAPIPNPVPEMASIPDPPEAQVAQVSEPPSAASTGSGDESTLNRAAKIAAAAASLFVSPAEAASAPQSSAQEPLRPAARTRFYVQVGTFSQIANAEALYRDVAAMGRAAIVPAMTGDQPLYRVRIGPISSREEASGILQDVLSRGHPGAQIIDE